MRLGLVGPSEDSEAALRDAVQFLLCDADAEQVIYLGDGEFAGRALEAWRLELEGGEGARDFLSRATDAVVRGPSHAIEALLEADALRAALDGVRILPAAPARAVELLDDRVVLLVHDKSVLDEEDIANAHLVVYGRSEASELRRFGRRIFFTPGPVSLGHVGLLEASEDGVTLALYDLEGVPLWRESVATGSTKVTVAR
jgi:hypothetical protein